MIDFHTHILPEIDDGARSVRRSLEMYEYQKKTAVLTRLLQHRIFIPAI
ncbi:MAG: tyrosine protein phosphatase [Clostridiales bacterium]|nr:MAG: tyrosine protein phosphatase [Clostridiales bacterium]